MSYPSLPSDLISAAQSGDEHSTWDVVARCEPLIRSLIPMGSEDAEDLLQEGRIAVLTALRSYNTDAGAAFTTYAYQAVRQEMATREPARSPLTVEPYAVRTVRRTMWQAGGDAEAAYLLASSHPDPKKRMARETFYSVLAALQDHVTWESPAGGDSDGLTVADVLADAGADILSRSEAAIAAEQILNSPQMSARHVYVLRAHYGVGMSAIPAQQVAHEMGIKPKALHELRSRALKAAKAVATGTSK